MPKPHANINHERKASMGVISPTQNSSSLFENKLVFSGSQLQAFQTGDRRTPTVKEKLNVTQPIKNQVTKISV